MPITQNETTSTRDLTWVRSQFPALLQTVNGHPAVFLDEPGGTQMPQRVIDAITNYLAHDNANSGGAYATSRRTDAMIAGARTAMADFFNCDPDEVIFGQNMTALTFALSRALGRQFGPGNEILVTHLDHDANISPWRALEERGATVRFVDINEVDCTLDMSDLARKISGHTRLVAGASGANAVATVDIVIEVLRRCRQAGALTGLDALRDARLGPIDVRALDCDFLVCSTYKFFGPHMGILYGKREQLKRLHPYKVRALTNNSPFRWEWGTLNHECIAGITASVEYLADLGRRMDPSVQTRRAALLAAYGAIQHHERSLAEHLIRGLLAIPGLKLYGISDPKRFNQRCPTIAVRIAGHTPLKLATKLGELGFFTWDGNYYALNLAERLNVEKTGGFLRIGLVHYNTADEVDRFLTALREIVGA